MDCKNGKRVANVVAVLMLAFFMAACGQTSAPGPSETPQAVGNPAPASVSAGAPMQSVAAPYSPTGNGQYEQPPVVNAADLLPAGAMSGNGYQVQPQVPTNGAMGQYTIVADASVFHDNAGTYQVESLDLLKIRLSEIPAIATLENESKTSVFANAVATSAERPVKDAVQIVAHPMDTITGLPSGVGQLFGRVGMGAGELYSTASNSSESGSARASQTASQTANVTMTALGYDQVRRDLARTLNVDPYTSNPILKAKLNEVAWVMFSARLAVNTVISVAVPGSMIITGVEFTNDLVYQTPKGDLIILVQKKLQHLGLSNEEIATFTHNPAIPLSLQISAVKDLDSLGSIPGRRAVAVALASVMTEYQARFIVTSIRMLAQWSQQNSPITNIGAPGTLIGRDQNGKVIMPAPVDYLSWTERIAGFATDPRLIRVRHRVLWIPAPMTPLARQQLQANGWSVHESAQP